MLSKFEKYLKFIYPLILLLYPLRHIRVGAEWWDTGYNYANFTYMDRMDEMWLFSTYLGNAMGNFLQKLPFGNSMVGLNLYTGLFVSTLALLGYFFFVKMVKLPEWLVFAGEFLAVSLCWCPTALLYNYLTYLLMGIAYLLLYKALMDENGGTKYFVSAGVVLGINVYTRFSNLAQMALIVAVWAMAVIRKEKVGTVVKQTLWCVCGYLIGLAGMFGYIRVRYGAGVYVNAILRLLQMPAEASSYTMMSMVEYQIRNYIQNLLWLRYFAALAVAGLLVYAFFPKKVKWIAKIGYVGVYVLMLYYLRNQNMFNLKYSTKMSAFQWGVILLTITWIVGLIVIFGKKFSNRDKLLCGMNIILIVITPLGSNNHLYASINNLFLVAPFTLWMVWRFLKWMPEQIHFKKCPKAVETYPVKALILCVGVTILIQSTLFGWFYVFSEGDGGENLHTKIENSVILKGMLTSPDRAEAIASIAEYVNDNELKGREVILYGQIPSLSYYLEMPFAITAWPDLASYNYEIMKKDLEILSAHVDAKEKHAPVILLEIRQGTYLLDGEPGLKQLGIGEPAVATIAADPKLQLLDEFMKEYGYEKTFENTKFIMFQANAERREKQ